jgi:hypothetical protein
LRRRGAACFHPLCREIQRENDQGVPRLELPAAAGTVMITSPYDLSFEHRIDVVDRASIESIAITGPTTQLVVGSLSDLRADLLVGTRPICGGSMAITTTNIAGAENDVSGISAA